MNYEHCATHKHKHHHEMLKCFVKRLPQVTKTIFWFFFLFYFISQSYHAKLDGNLTCKTRFGSPVFCDNCFRSLASGLWFIAKYDFIVRNWWCLNDVRIRFVRDDALPILPRPKPKSIYSEFKSEKQDKEIKKLQNTFFATRSEIVDNISSFSRFILWFIVVWSLFN